MKRTRPEWLIDYARLVYGLLRISNCVDCVTKIHDERREFQKFCSLAQTLSHFLSLLACVGHLRKFFVDDQHICLFIPMTMHLQWSLHRRWRESTPPHISSAATPETSSKFSSFFTRDPRKHRNFFKTQRAHVSSVRYFVTKLQTASSSASSFIDALRDPHSPAKNLFHYSALAGTTA